MRWERCPCKGLYCVLDSEDERHGSVNGYQNLKCRCQDCRHAWAEDMRAKRRRRHDKMMAGEAQPAKHGTTGTYNNWMCRCPACSAVQAQTAKDRRSPP